MTYFTDTLKDPYSAHIDIQAPEKFWYQEPALADGWTGGQRHAGWMVRVLVNAKNSYGGYVGNETYGFFFQNSRLVKVLEPDDWSTMGTISDPLFR